VSKSRCVVVSNVLGVLGALALAAAAGAQNADELQKKAAGIFMPLPKEMSSAENPVTAEKITLGRMLYYDPRLSKSQTISCNTCHLLDKAGVDNAATSEGHKKQHGDRNSPSSYNAALHVAQFWDGRAATVEEQAKGPVLNPVEMAMPSEAATVAVLRSIPGYAPLFAAAFPGTQDPITYDNMARAIGAFERRLVTPSAFDRFLEGDVKALTPEQLAGLDVFLSAGCTTCHNGAGVGGGLYQKIGLVHEYPTQDIGRAKITKNDADKFFFKVPSLRNVVLTGPYFHDGKVTTVEEAVRLMVWHQLGKELKPEQVKSIVAFLGSLTGTPDASSIAKPALPPSGKNTPKPDPS
jgi:cytochrome c peroxidase